MSDKPPEQVLKLIYDILPQVRVTLVKGSPKEGTYTKTTITDYMVATVYLRCRSLFEGVITLVDNNLAEEACIVGRSLLEDSLKLYHIYKSPEDRRLEYFAHLIKVSTNNNKNLLLSLMKGRPEDVIEKVKTRIQDNENRLTEFKKLHKIKKNKNLPNATNLVGMYMKDDKYAFDLSNIMTHGSSVSQIFRTIESGEGDLFKVDIYTKYDHPLLKLVILHISMIAILKAHIAASKLLNWRDISDPVVLINKINNITDEDV